MYYYYYYFQSLFTKSMISLNKKPPRYWGEIKVALIWNGDLMR